MTWLGYVTVIGIIAVAVLVIVLLRQHTKDVIEEKVRRRTSSSRLAGRAEYVEGRDHIPVAISLSDSAIWYENADIEAHLDLERIDEVEYDDELATAQAVPKGRVLRLRSHGHAFEFILDDQSAKRWMSALPPHRMGDQATA